MEKKNSIELEQFKGPTLNDLEAKKESKEIIYKTNTPEENSFSNRNKNKCEKILPCIHLIAIIVTAVIASIALGLSIISYNVNAEQNIELSKFNSYFQESNANENKNFTNEIEELENKTKKQEEDIDKSLSELEYLNKQVVIQNKTINDLTTKNENHENKINELNSKTKNLEDQLTKTESQIDVLKAEKETFKSNISSLTKENALLKISLTTHNSTLTRMNESIISLNNNISKQSSSMDFIKTNVDLLKENITKLEEPSKLIEQFQTISTEIYSISNKVSNITANMSEINKINNQTMIMK